MRTVFVVHRVPDQDWSSSTGDVLIGLFDEQADAVQAARGQGSWGVSDGPITEATVFSSLEEYQNYVTSIRQKEAEVGSANLTTFERAVISRIEPK
jgi:hypothetical protein